MLKQKNYWRNKIVYTQTDDPVPYIITTTDNSSPYIVNGNSIPYYTISATTSTFEQEIYPKIPNSLGLLYIEGDKILIRKVDGEIILWVLWVKEMKKHQSNL